LPHTTVAYHRRPPGNGPLGRMLDRTIRAEVRSRWDERRSHARLQQEIAERWCEAKRWRLRAERTRGGGKAGFSRGAPTAKRRQPRRQAQRSPCPAPQCGTQL